MMIPVKRNQNWLPGIFNDFFGNEWMQKSTETSPAINIAESDKAFYVEVAVPGLTKNDCNVRIENENELVISMEKKQEQKEEDKEGRYLRREFSYSKFQKMLILPETVDKDKIEAKVEDGVLNINIPKKELAVQQKSSKQIEIH